MPVVTHPGTTPEIGERDASQVEKIPPYKVIFVNDDVTTMEFVVLMLITIFKKDQPTAVRLMLEVHHSGAAVIDVLPFEEAEHRQQLVHSAAQSAGFPLRCLIEPA
jgi:ATP-dependent Clp protease adaptor protein ClpS